MNSVDVEKQQKSIGSSSILALAIYLTMLHYGGGFLLGTGEKAVSQGLAASIYPISAAVGMLAILIFARVYIRERKQLADILGNKYGSFVRNAVGFLSWVWMIGVAASQIIGGRAVLRMLGVDAGLIVILVFAAVMVGIALLSSHLLKYFFYALLAISTGALIFAILRLNGIEAVSVYLQAPINFAGSLSTLGLGALIGIPVTTILLTAIGEDFQEYLIDAKSLNIAIWGCVFSALVLLALAFLPSIAVTVAQSKGILDQSVDAREAIPFILAWSGGGKSTVPGFLLGSSLLIIVAGSGGGLLRALNSRIYNLRVNFGKLHDPVTPLRFEALSTSSKLVYAIFNSVFIVLIALSDRDIIDIIVQFYAVYVAAAFLPAVTLLIPSFEGISTRAIQVSIMLGTIVSLLILIINLDVVRFAILDDVALTIILFGMLASFLGLVVGRFWRVGRQN